MGFLPRSPGRYSPVVAHLPPAGSVDVGKLARLFRSTTNSYKYVFFMGLLACLRKRLGDDSSIRISLRELIIEELVIAWYPHTYFRLRFGARDMLGKALDDIFGDTVGLNLTFSTRDLDRLRLAINAAFDSKGLQVLARWVPFRLLTPFFEAECKGRKDHEKNGLIERLARERFQEVIPLYRLDGEEIEIHPAWVDYLNTNLAVVQDWAAWQWLDYMRARNPNVPNVAGKLFPVLERSSLGRQRKFWARALEHREIRCLYSGAPLERIEALDHYLPWSFVLHDQLWNLVPASQEANSSKRDHLADSQYLDRLVRVQVDGLLVHHENSTEARWNVLTEDYLIGLNLGPEDLGWDTVREASLRAALHRGYEATIPTLAQLAVNQGFPAGWRYAPAA